MKIKEQKVKDSFGAEDRAAEEVARNVFEYLFGEKRIINSCAQLLADSILLAHQMGDQCWSLTLFPDKVRLNVGPVEVLVLLHNEVFLMLEGSDSDDLRNGELAPFISATEVFYPSVPVDQIFCRLPPEKLDYLYPVISERHQAFIQLAAKRRKKSSWGASFSPGVLAYINKLLGVKLPVPSYFSDGWKGEVRQWVQKRRGIPREFADDIILFFDRAFQNTMCPDRAWFGVHSSVVSLVVGGIFLASLTVSGEEPGLWLLLDQNPPEVEGLDFRQVKSTLASRSPLTWGYSPTFSVIPQILENKPLWDSFASATQKVVYASRSAGDRDSVQENRKKRRLIDFYRKFDLNTFPDEVDDAIGFPEGGKYQVTVNAYERNRDARTECIEQYGTRCVVCGLSFGEAYGEIADGYIHVHHLRPLSEIGAEYRVDPVKDLRPVCPNCHAVLHLRKPAFSIEEVMELLREQRNLVNSK